MRQQEVGIRQPRSDVKRPLVAGEDSSIRLPVRRVVERHEPVMLTDDVVVAVERRKPEKQQKRIGRAGQDGQQEKHRAYGKRQEARKEEARSGGPFQAIEIRPRKRRADMRAVEDEQPDPPQRDDRRAHGEIKDEEQQAESGSAEKQREVESAADDPPRGDRLSHAQMIRSARIDPRP